MMDVGDLAVLVEMDREHRARFDPRIEESDGLFAARDVIPGVAAEGGLGGGIAEALLDRRLRVVADLDRRFADGIRQIAALVDDGRAAQQQGRRKREYRNPHGYVLTPEPSIPRPMC